MTSSKHPSLKSPVRQHIGLFFLVCFFILASTPRLLSLNAHWSSDEARWLRRSSEFMSAVKQGEFSETLIAYHPGVTTMWFAGLRSFFTQPRIDVENLASARWFIGIVVSVGICAVCLLLYKLFGQWVALASFACLATSPLFLAQTRRVHTDALAATFILITVLLFLCYCQHQQQRRYLTFSAIAFGLAVLSKSYALILVPWMPLCLFLFRKYRIRNRNQFSTSIAEFLCFLNCVVVAVLVLWPVFWTPIFGLLTLCLLVLTFVLFRRIKKEHCPIGLLIASLLGFVLACVHAIQTIWLVFDRIGWAVTTPHNVEHLFLGKVIYDPGWLFYPFVLTIKSTPLMLSLAFIGCFLLWKQRKHSEEISRQSRMVLAIVTGVVFFTLCLSATSKKFSRYLLPAFLMLEVLSAIGFVEGLKWSYTALRSRFGTKETNRYKVPLAVMVCLSFFVIQILPVLTLHPYYGTYYNLCWKVTDITKIITVGDASGIDIAAKYLNRRAPTHRQLRVQVSPLMTSSFVRYFTSAVKPVGTEREPPIEAEPPVDYEVVYIRDSQIGSIPQTGILNGELEAVITLNGIDHVWIYRIEKP